LLLSVPKLLLETLYLSAHLLETHLALLDVVIHLDVHVFNACSDLLHRVQLLNLVDNVVDAANERADQFEFLQILRLKPTTLLNQLGRVLP
jgi:hypothetical protein